MTITVDHQTPQFVPEPNPYATAVTACVLVHCRCGYSFRACINEGVPRTLITCTYCKARHVWKQAGSEDPLTLSDTVLRRIPVPGSRLEEFYASVEAGVILSVDEHLPEEHKEVIAKQAVSTLEHRIYGEVRRKAKRAAILLRRATLVPSKEGLELAGILQELARYGFAPGLTATEDA